MKTFVTFVTLSAFIGVYINPASAECFGSGDEWQDREAARQHVVNACRGYDGNTGAFQGVFAPEEYKRACVQHSPTQRLDFTIRNTNTNDAIDLGDDDCVLRLQNEINGCSRGGSSVVSGWLFTADPNNGLC
ncbi:hypothetical protein FSARC_3541 [Fusarium sarcochroum]|uniref:Secreted protein n=1 Tax=Fusarium sarcochroum TaxID=1208366 RepID=A0A8H4U3F5_9HYPO|nr:hypothetical protein FSARC_3541 [Fusarium sarcochroum]